MNETESDAPHTHVSRFASPKLFAKAGRSTESAVPLHSSLSEGGEADTPTPPAGGSPYGSKRILIITPLMPPEPGGPSYYSVALKEALERQGQEVTLKAFHDVRHLPSGIRHLVFLWQVFRLARHADVLIVLDTVSVALPAVLAAKLARKPVIIRTGGDFVWEQYVERTGEKVPLSTFYTAPRDLSYKERSLMWVQKTVVFPNASCLVFSTTWQRNIWEVPYGLKHARTAIIENHYEPTGTRATGDGAFLWAGRDLVLKNVTSLEGALQALQDRGVTAKVTYLRNVPRSVLEVELGRARALVIPSISEISPNLALEALAKGVPVILTKECGIRDRLGDAVMYVDPLDQEELGAALEKLMDAGALQEARKRASAFSHVHTYNDIAREFLVLYNSI